VLSNHHQHSLRLRIHQVLGSAVDLDQEKRFRIHRQSNLRVALDGLNGHPVHDLQRGGDDVGLDDARHRVSRVFEPPKRRQHGLPVLGRRDELDGDLGDDPQGAFGTDEEGGEIVGGDIFTVFPRT
jgi:hypothetical protein